jgi:hypothetical protein
MKANFQTIYESIGYLFYALGAKHGKLSCEEYERLKGLICQKWQPELTSYHIRHLNTYESLQTDLIDHIHMAVKKAYENQLCGHQAFEYFKDYYCQHTTPYGESLKENMISTSKQIARAFSSDNDPATDILSEVKVLLGFTPTSSSPYRNDGHIHTSIQAAYHTNQVGDAMHR